MRVRYLVVASVLAGASLGVAVTWAKLHHAPPQLFPGMQAVEGEVAGAPKVKVDQTEHDFGYVEQRAPTMHAFRFTNVGTGTLTLKAGLTTCSACTIAELKKPRLAPGESTEVVVEYLPAGGKPDFRQTAFVMTNDPDQPRVELNIRGKVTSRYRLSPPNLVFGRVSTSAPSTAALNVYCFVSDELRVFDPVFVDKETAEFFEAKIEPVPPEELAPLSAKSGKRVLVTVKPGLPLGPFRQTIRLQFETPESEKPTSNDVSINGNVASDLSIVGAGWSAMTGILSIGSVSAAEGATRKVTVLVRGEGRENVEVEPLELRPPWLRVSVGKSSKLNESVNQIPVTIEIPPGRPPAVYLGTDQGDFAVIDLAVKNKPDVKKVRMHLKFVIDKGN